MVINENTINSASVSELLSMFKELKNSSPLSDKEIFYYNMIDKRLSDINKKRKKTEEESLMEFALRNGCDFMDMNTMTIYSAGGQKE